ncbi:MAG: TVP38/TMEM64 family protein [Dehalococcoidia bacterium]
MDDQRLPEADSTTGGDVAAAAEVLTGGQTPLLLRWPVITGLAVGLAALVVAYIVAARALGFSTEIDAEPFRDWVDGFGVWGPVIFVCVLAFSVLFAPIPNAPIFIAAGLVWGAILGTVYSVAGLLLGSVIAFWVSRKLGRRHLPRLIGPAAAARLDRLAETMGGKVIFWARMLPAVNFDWISFVAGVTSITFREFISWSFLGMILPTSIVVVAGDGLGRDFRITIAMGAVWVGGIALSALVFWLRRRPSRPAGSSA